MLRMCKQLAVLLLTAVAAVAQTGPAKTPTPQQKAAPRKVPGAQNGAEVPRTPEAIVNFLIPDNVAYTERLSQVPTPQAIAALKQAQKDATGASANAIAFLLVVLDSDADANLTHLLNSLQKCTTDPENCDEAAIPYLGNLFERGDKSVAEPLLAAATNAEGTVAESLGGTYGDMIAHDPLAFITAVSRRPAKDRRKLCMMVASGGDGGGLPDDTSVEVQAALEKLTQEPGTTSTTAKLCLEEIKKAAGKF